MELENSEGKRGTGLLAVISRINGEMLSLPNDKCSRRAVCIVL